MGGYIPRSVCKVPTSHASGLIPDRIKAMKTDVPTNALRRHAWSHNFGRGLECTATFNPDGSLAYEWSARPPVHNRGFIRAYVRWVEHVCHQVAQISGNAILQAIQTGPDEWTTIIAKPPAPSRP